MSARVRVERRNERGAVAIITAIVVMFVAVGMLAMSVDIGRITYDRSQLQNGADAVAFALATDCAKNASDLNCSAVASAAIQTLANQNSHSSGLEDLSTTGRPASQPPICFQNFVPKAGALTNCPPSATTTTDLTNCLPVPSSLANAPYVEVRTRTQTSSGTSLPAVFGQLVGGQPSTTQITCSRVAWAVAGSTGPTLPITMGMCDWNSVTQNGTKYAPSPAYSIAPGPVGVPNALPAEVGPYAVGIFTHASGIAPNTSDPTCSGSPGLNYPGGFGWLSSDASCTATILVGSTITGDTGASLPTPCANLLQTYLGTEVSIPIFDSVVGSGSSGTYHIAGVAKFYFAGWDQVPSVNPQKTASVYKEPSTICTGKCNGSTEYIWGWFTTGLLPPSANAGPPGGSDYGVKQIVPAG